MNSPLWRDHLGQRLANLALRIATPEYRSLVHGLIRYGMNAAAQDTAQGRPVPPDWRGR